MVITQLIVGLQRFKLLNNDRQTVREVQVCAIPECHKMSFRLEPRVSHLQHQVSRIIFFIHPKRSMKRNQFAE